VGDEEACRELQWVEDNRRDIPHVIRGDDSWLLICSRVARCLARTHACGIEPSRPLAKLFRSHSRTRRFNSARTSGFYNSVVLPTCCDAIRAGLPPPPVMRCASNLRCCFCLDRLVLLLLCSLARASVARTSTPRYSSSSSSAGPTSPRPCRAAPAYRCPAQLLLFSCYRTHACSGFAVSFPRMPEPRAFSTRVTSWLHRPSSARTLPHRSSSARALPCREVRSSAAWLVCCSRVCSTPPARPRSARVCRCEFLRCQSLAARLRPNPAPSPSAASVLQRRSSCSCVALLTPALDPVPAAPPPATALFWRRTHTSPVPAHSFCVCTARRLGLLCSACFFALRATSTCVAPMPSHRSAPPAPSACSSSHRALARPAALTRPLAPAARPCPRCAACRQLAGHARAYSWAEPRPPPARQRASTRPRARARSRVPPLARARSVLGPPARSGQHASARAPLWRRVAPAPTR
jgi:hypothetical protein